MIASERTSAGCLSALSTKKKNVYERLKDTPTAVAIVYGRRWTMREIRRAGTAWIAVLSRVGGTRFVIGTVFFSFGRPLWRRGRVTGALGPGVRHAPGSHHVFCELKIDGGETSEHARVEINSELSGIRMECVCGLRGVRFCRIESPSLVYFYFYFLYKTIIR